jgi:hypothetical protein
MADEVTVSGPLFDGRAMVAADEATVAAQHAVALRGQELVRAAFDAAIANNSGKFDASITLTDVTRTYTTSSGRKSYSLVADVPAKTEVVTTSMASYGPWLEGVGSRNATTRFKGYQGFRRATDELDTQAAPIAEVAIVPFVMRMDI